jgi:hypothetical protein
VLETHCSLVDQVALEDPESIDPVRAIYSWHTHYQHLSRKCLLTKAFVSFILEMLFEQVPHRVEHKEVMETLQEEVNEVQGLQMGTNRGHVFGKKESQAIGELSQQMTQVV